MTYKNGLKEYSLTTVLFGAPMGLLLGLSSQSLIVGLIMGAFSGFLFTFLIFLFVKFQEKKFDEKRAEIAKERNVICDGGATIQGTGGWMFLTEQGIEFYPHKINVSQEELIIPMNVIASVKTNKNRIIINTIGNATFEVVVSHNKEWKKQIDLCLAGSMQK